MPKSYPGKIPAAFADHDKLSGAYKRGWNHGHGIACHNVPTPGETYWTYSVGKATADADTIREIHADLCYEAETNSRSYSPFESTAHEFNSAGYDGDDQERVEGEPMAEDLWSAFEAGAQDAITADLAKYTDEDYGIEAELADER